MCFRPKVTIDTDFMNLETLQAFKLGKSLREPHELYRIKLLA